MRSILADMKTETHPSYRKYTDTDYKKICDFICYWFLSGRDNIERNEDVMS